ncbi:b-box zinc finger [Teladorsagia circumcincta]|uniref:B-box zinc finger n=1 Tax=Teladorsagia circumcincta TaxID=45464 RepID=A0A2G9UUV8_TELCI|nr:b-box zinc finger [Teladorsagia circumcincta]
MFVGRSYLLPVFYRAYIQYAPIVHRVARQQARVRPAHSLRILPTTLLNFLSIPHMKRLRSTKQPMYYCETCQQALCHDCRNTTHKARMFSAHRVVVAEESARVRGRIACAQHSEPYILYCTENKSLACIQCFNERPPEDRHYFVSIDAGYKSCTEKIEKWAMKLRLYQVLCTIYLVVELYHQAI